MKKNGSLYLKYVCYLLLLMGWCVLFLFKPAMAVDFTCNSRVQLHDGDKVIDMDGGYSYYHTNCDWYGIYNDGTVYRNYRIGVNNGGYGCKVGYFFLEIVDYDWLGSACQRNYDYFEGPKEIRKNDPSGTYIIFESDYEGWTPCEHSSIQITVVPYTYNVVIEPPGSGTVTVSPEGPYLGGEKLTVTANNGAEHVFDHWKEGYSTWKGNPLSFTVDDDENHMAVFRESDMKLTAGALNPETAYFNPMEGEYAADAIHISLQNKSVDYITLDSLAFTISGDIERIASAMLYRDNNCSGSTAGIKTIPSISTPYLSFDNLNQQIKGSQSVCFWVKLNFHPETFLFRETFGVSIAPENVRATLNETQAGVSGSTVKGTVISAGPNIDLAAQWDGAPGDGQYGTYISAIPLDNLFTANIDMAPEGFGTVSKVDFSLGGSVVPGTPVTPGSVYTATLDMAAVSSEQSLDVILTMMVDGQEMTATKSYPLKGIVYPEWIDILFGISDSFTKSFDTEGAAYEVGFSYPVDFVWNEIIPSDVGLLGGLQTDLGIEFSGQAAYALDESSIFSAEASGTPMVLGREIELEGALSGEFDAEFRFLRGNGEIAASTAFDLPEKGYSKTFLIYGVPVTAAVDLSGDVTLFVNGSAVLNRSLEFEEASVSPGVTVTGNVTVSLSAVAGLAKIAATGSPSVTLDIRIHYQTDAGTTTTWSGSVVVPITVMGSVFWGLADAELYSTELGPWNFGNGGGRRESQDIPEIHVPRLLSSTALAIDDQGRRMAIWVSDAVSTALDSPVPEVYYRYDGGSGWSGRDMIINGYPNDQWDSDPAVVFLSGGNAVAAWTINDGAKTLDNFNDILAAQDIYAAYWNGTIWSDPVRIIDDGEADGAVCLAYDSTNNRVHAVWVHDANTDGDIDTKTEWELLHAIYNPDTAAWTAPSVIADTGGGTADFMPALSFDDSGNGMLVWARDNDGAFFETLAQVTDGTNVDDANDDSDIMYAIYSGSAWSNPGTITTPDSSTDCQPSVAHFSDGTAGVVWIKKTEGTEALYYNVYSGGVWSTPELIDQGPVSEDPRILIDGSDHVSIVWRSNTDIFSSTMNADARRESTWSAPRSATGDNAVDLNISAATDSTGNIELLWFKYDLTTGNVSSTTGFQSGIHSVKLNPGTAMLKGVYADEGIDADGDERYDTLDISVDIDVTTYGNYEVRAELWGQGLIAEESAVLNGLSVDEHTFVLSFPGDKIRTLQENGPYVLKNVSIHDLLQSGIETDFAASPYTTAAYTYNEFETSRLTFDIDQFNPDTDSSMITLTDADRNEHSSLIETVTVRLVSTLDPTGFDMVLTETGGNTGIFTGAIGFDTTTSNPAENTILVGDTSVVHVIYMDAGDFAWRASAVWSALLYGDLNADREITLADAILALNLFAGFDNGNILAEYGIYGSWLDGNQKIDITECLYILQCIGNLR